MAKTPIQIRDLATQVAATEDAFVDLSNTIAAPYTTVIGRARMTNLEKDIKVNMGVDRFMFQDLFLIESERGPNNYSVWGVTNDKHNQVRFVGTSAPGYTSTGTYINLNDIDQYVEITFYGTGLNLLVSSPGASADYRAKVDGGTEGANFVTYAATASAVLNSRNYSPNQVINAVSGLSLGIHTVSIRRAGGGGGFMNIHGFEAITVNGISPNLLHCNAGDIYSNGVKRTSNGATLAYNEGVVGSRGACVVVYQNEDGSIEQAVQETDSSSLTLTSTDHSNEDIVRVYGFREFSFGRSDDFSRLDGSTSGSKAAVLGDGTTSLFALGLADVSGGIDQVITDSTANSGQLMLTFVGTGLDLVGDYGGSASNVWTVYVDGSSIGVLSRGAYRSLLMPIVSGLPYGTHTVRLVPNAGTANVAWGFAVYAPKKPPIPDNAVELAQYYVMATHGTNLAAEGGYTVSQGVMRKHITREVNFVGTWSISSINLSNAPLSAFQIFTTTVGSYAEYTFVGTGVELRLNSENAMTSRISIDGSTDLSGFTTSTSGGSLSFTASTGQFSGNTPGGARISISGLTFGIHTIRVELLASTGGGLYVEAFDIVTPIHTVAFSGPAIVGNTLAVGNQAINDLRKFSSKQIKIAQPSCKALGISGTVTTTISSSSQSPSLADFLCVIKTNGNPLIIDGACHFTSDTTGGDADLQLYVDGYSKDIERAIDVPSNGFEATVVVNSIVPVSAGVHVVYAKFRTNTGTLSANSNRRWLMVKEQSDQ